MTLMLLASFVVVGNSSSANTLEEGYQAYIKTDFSGAKEKLTEAVKNESNPVKLTKIHKLLGIVHYMLSDLNESARSFKLALSYNPNISVLQSEVLDETIITFFNRIKTLETTKIQENPSPKKKRKKRFRYVKKRRPLTTTEKIYATLPFGVGQFMHRQYFFGALSGALQGGALGYYLFLGSQIDSKKSDNATFQASGAGDDVKSAVSAEINDQIKDLEARQLYSLVGFFSLWAVSSVDAYLTPKYRRIKRRVYDDDDARLKPTYDLNLGIAPNLESQTPDLVFQLNARF